MISGRLVNTGTVTVGTASTTSYLELASASSFTNEGALQVSTGSTVSIDGASTGPSKPGAAFTERVRRHHQRGRRRRRRLLHRGRRHRRNGDRRQPRLPPQRVVDRLRRHRSVRLPRHGPVDLDPEGRARPATSGRGSRSPSAARTSAAAPAPRLSAPRRASPTPARSRSGTTPSAAAAMAAPCSPWRRERRSPTAARSPPPARAARRAMTG